ncbi:hypothetical protein DM01DRAFT_1172190 [Hesseltinella vesiculosa]|uniref:Uncharacterized protein n=1 Tax=Hesseltinella vesiculosa TaxID=101127 RepID=A0A1X2G5F5_9FUNG|nr:hypothetical protein DM01DRAFT_1172190 [Hesseltinella vesiculosa]
MAEPHPRLIQSDPAVSDVAPLAQCSDCKCKRHLPEFEGRRCWYRTCVQGKEGWVQGRKHFFWAFPDNDGRDTLEKRVAFL